MRYILFILSLILLASILFKGIFFFFWEIIIVLIPAIIFGQHCGVNMNTSFCQAAGGQDFINLLNFLSYTTAFVFFTIIALSIQKLKHLVK